MFKNVKKRTLALIAAIFLTFGLIATAAPSLPANAETIVTTEQQRPGDGNGRGGRNERRGDRGPRDDRGPDLVEDFFDF